MLKNASWLFALTLGALLFFAYSQIPAQGDSTLALHLSNRYLHQSAAETGIQSPAGAVAGDYRGFDLLAVGFLYSFSALSLFLFWTAAPQWTVLFPAFLWILGPVLTLGYGFFALVHGSNFLDYEALGLVSDPILARFHGVLFLTIGFLCSLGGFLLMVVQWVQHPEASLER